MSITEDNYNIHSKLYTAVEAEVIWMRIQLEKYKIPILKRRNYTYYLPGCYIQLRDPGTPLRWVNPITIKLKFSKMPSLLLYLKRFCDIYKKYELLRQIVLPELSLLISENLFEMLFAMYRNQN